MKKGLLLIAFFWTTMDSLGNLDDDGITDIGVGASDSLIQDYETDVTSIIYTV